MWWCVCITAVVVEEEILRLGCGRSGVSGRRATCNNNTIGGKMGFECYLQLWKLLPAETLLKHAGSVCSFPLLA